jgi:DNA topoisomerase-2
MSVNKTKYQRKNHIDHVRDRPENYVGSTVFRNSEEFVVVDNLNHIEKKSVKICPAIIRIFIEPLSNTVDNLARSKKSKVKMNKICIDIDEKTGETSFWNDGEFIPIEIHEEEKCYNHTLIFGTLLTGSNYDDNNDDRIDISGKNGIGIKAVNILSKKFTIEGVDPINKKYFKQT